MQQTPPQSWGEPRSRTVTWFDPMLTAGRAAAMPGLEFMQAVMAGDVPGPPRWSSKVSYLRPVTRDSGELVTVGTVTKPGRRAAFAEGTVHDGAGRLVATASSTLLVFPLPA